MKKTVLMIVCALATTGAFAQELTSKKGTPILPAAGEWSIGFNAVPFLDWAFDKSRVMSSSGASSAENTLGWTADNDHVIVGKMMKDEKTAYRLKLRLGINSEKMTEAVPTGGFASGDLKDSTVSSSAINLAGGIQKYRGQGRLKGYYGAEAGLGLKGGKTKYTYNDPQVGQVLEDKKGSTFELNIRGFIGAEYFFAPKMSCSVEYGWGLSLDSTGEGETKIQGSQATKTGKNSEFGLDTDNMMGAINLNFYF